MTLERDFEPVSPEATELVAMPAGFETGRGRVYRRFRSNAGAMVGLFLMIFIVLSALLSPLLAPYDPLAGNPSIRNQAPSGSHWFGTDQVGRDIFSRVMFGGRASLMVGVIVVVLALLVSLPVGLVCGYVGGRLDGITMRFMDALFAFPSITLAVVISGVVLGEGASTNKSLMVCGVAIAVTFVPGLVRILRSQVLAVREENYVEASRSIGVTDNRMVRKHVFPNVVSPLIVQVALTFGYAILAEAGLSFLGFGVQGFTPSWGTMLAAGYNRIYEAQLPIIIPGLAIMFTVLAANLIADGLRDAMGREVFTVKDAE
jgi:ABC-type dipeptide/oligopeptide/nickel transport system permease subunit